METRGNYVTVGAFVLVLFVGLIAFVLWLTNFYGVRDYERYDIYFQESVSGLSRGGVVTYQGVTVGEVRDIRILPEDVERVLVTVEILADTPVREDTTARLEFEGITGNLMITLRGGSQEAAPLQARAGEPRPVITAEASRFEQFLEGAPTLVDSVNALVLQANQILGPENQAALAQTLENLNAFSTALAAQSDNVASAIESAAGTMEKLGAASESLDRLAHQVEADVGQLLATINATAKTLDEAIARTGEDAGELLTELRGTAQSMTAVTRQVEAMVAENREPLREFSSTGLYELSGLVNELRGLVVSLNRVTTEVTRDPARFLFGTQRDGYQAN